MHKINIFDVDFAHATSSVHGKIPKKFDYIRNQMDWDGITVFTNDLVFSKAVDTVKSKYKIAWLLEPKSIKSSIYEFIERVEHKFDYVITHDDYLLGKSKKYIFAPVGGCWIHEEFSPNKKSKLISIIASDKNITDGHKLRHEIISIFGRDIDVFGKGYNPIKNKEEGLSDYRFSICIENCSVKNYFTEKLIDCFATKTIPIYWGCTNISDFFDKNSFLQFQNINELTSIIENIQNVSIEKSLIDKNYDLSKKYWITEDWIFENFFSRLL